MKKNEIHAINTNWMSSQHLNKSDTFLERWTIQNFPIHHISNKVYLQSLDLQQNRSHQNQWQAEGQQVEKQEAWVEWEQSAADFWTHLDY